MRDPEKLKQPMRDDATQFSEKGISLNFRLFRVYIFALLRQPNISASLCTCK